VAIQSVPQAKSSLPPEPWITNLAFAAAAPAKPTSLFLSFDNTNAAAQRWVIEWSPTEVHPVWTVLTNGSVAANGSVTVQVTNNQAKAFYRAGFIWP
jgi:hypothetical protein